MAVAQLVESRIVIPVVVGSSPISHPSIYAGSQLGNPHFFWEYEFQKVDFFGIRRSQPTICLDRQQEWRGCTEGSFYLLFFLKFEIGGYRYGGMPVQSNQSLN